MLSHNKEFFSCQEHLGLILNTDGVALFKSSRSVLWPVYLQIANLPPPICFRYDNVITCGLWVGQSKPDMDILLKSILEEIDHINTLGFSFSGTEGQKTVRVKLLFGVFDLIAKAKVLNMMQFNGFCGCPTCVHPSEHKGARVYLPGTSYPLRTMVRIERAIKEGERCGTVVEGIKGKSPLHNYLDLVDGVPADYMHCVLEGVVKFLLTAWTCPKHRQKPFSIRSHLSDLDKALLEQTPPHEFTRPPRSVMTHLSYWKASEFRSWLLFYSLPLVLNMLPPLYLHHYTLLVCALHLLLLKEVTQIQCGAAEEMLNDFCSLLPELYGENSCTMNAHSLLHLPHFVRLWGPCWTHSAFSFESHNGSLKRMVHSTRKVVEQLSFSLDVKLTLQILYHEIEDRESEHLLHFLNFSGHARSTMSKMRHGYAIGTITTCNLSSLEFHEMKRICPYVSREVRMFHWFFFNNIMLHSVCYCAGRGKRNSTYCCYKNSDGVDTFGEIQSFVECSPLGTVAFIKPFTKTCSNILNTSGEPCRPVLEMYAQMSLISKFIVEIHPLGDVPAQAILLNDITSNCILVTPLESSLLYIVKLPNNYEHY